MRDIQLLDRGEGAIERGVYLCAAMRRSQVPAQLAERAEDTGAVEPLSLTMFAKAHSPSNVSALFPDYGSCSGRGELDEEFRSCRPSNYSGDRTPMSPNCRFLIAIAVV